ncbi:MAG: hypothetical protein ACI4ED_03705, partial [Suilimivivens sp.]
MGYEEYMKKNFDEEKAKIIVTVIPFVLIIIILLVILIVNFVKSNDAKNVNQDLQESIKEYADENRSELTNADSSEANSSNVISESSVSSEETKTDSSSSAELLKGADATPTPYQEIMQKGKVDYDKIEFNKDEQLKEMMTYWEDNNQKALDDLAGLDRFRAMSWKLRGTKDFYYYGEKDGNGQPNGTGIAVYADNQYYYGSWENGVRSGKGTWIHYHVHETPSTTDLYTYHQYTGSWKNDLPDGEGSEHYDFNMELLKENTRYTSNLIGSYSA